jgi:hypothetical protein
MGVALNVNESLRSVGGAFKNVNIRGCYFMNG